MKPLWRIARLTTYMAAILLIGCIYDPLERARQAAEMGDAQAQLELGQMYYEGKKVPQDYAEAARWYRKSAEQGNVHAQNLLGKRYEAGEGVPQDYAEAVR
jgi:hypothetical protein